jgi:hypothetical protein
MCCALSGASLLPELTRVIIIVTGGVGVSIVKTI